MLRLLSKIDGVPPPFGSEEMLLGYSLVHVLVEQLSLPDCGLKYASHTLSHDAGANQKTYEQHLRHCNWVDSAKNCCVDAAPGHKGGPRKIFCVPTNPHAHDPKSAVRSSSRLLRLVDHPQEFACLLQQSRSPAGS